MRFKYKPIGWPLAAALAAGAVCGATAPGVAQTVAPQPTRTIHLDLGRGQLVTLPRAMSDVFVADPKTADVDVRSPTQLYLFGKGAGETTVYATNKAGGVVFSATVQVAPNVNSVGDMLKLAMPDADIVVTPMNGLILLTGTVAQPDDIAEAERLAQAFVGKDVQVLTRLKTATPLQVSLQVRVAEVSRSFVKNIGVNLTGQDTTGGFQFGIDSGSTNGSTYVHGGKGGLTLKPGGQRTTIGMAGHLLGLDLLSALDLGETDGQVTTLENTNLAALSGETATFLAGGEIPIPVNQGLGAVSVEYKQYGVSLAYTPTVLSDGRISLRVKPEVSQLSDAGAVVLDNFTIPALTTRRAETTVELGSGQSFMIGGLLQNSNDNQVEKAPGIGDLPVIGTLFRSNAFKRNETELVIVITPYLVKPVDSLAQISLPTDGYKAPTDLGRVLLGKLSSGDSTPRPVPTMAPPAAAEPAIGASAPLPAGPTPKQPNQQQAAPATAAPAKDGDAAPGFSLN
ncbi:type II and III secretion system protein family protein [Hephaestia mangrovi]|uniref:type II and III secretion system protein family protein n=1 Tax=Hephaestia mangrovi TaxID=2873268 RepID=UPI001CA634B8|nr:type II and III secretion system protein family protein [Hephaestia mangrovi]MBY8828202.1 type II and III secretion system protein family protein [Hephaestia mangrovi]